MITEPNEPSSPCKIRRPKYYNDVVAQAMLPELEDVTFGGLTKREYFAGLAMAANITRNESMRSEEIAKFSVRDADALIAELNTPKPCIHFG